MAVQELVFKANGNVDVQPGGPGNNWQYFSACATMSGPSIPLGGIEIRRCQDPNIAGGFMISSTFRTSADLIGFDITTKLGKVNELAKLNKSFGVRARWANCGTRHDTRNYDPLMLHYCHADITDRNYEDLVVIDGNDNDEIVITSPVMARSELRITKLSSGRVGDATTLGDIAINDLVYCTDCTSIGSQLPCAKVYAVTGLDTAPYPTATLITGTRDEWTDVITWDDEPILGLASAAEGVECAGDRVVVSSNGSTAVAYNDTPDDQDTWNVVVLGNAPSANPKALHMLDSNIGWVGCNNGYIYKTVNGSTTWTAMHSAGLTTEHINAVFAYNEDLVYAGGVNGVLLKSATGGLTWENISSSTIGSNNILVVSVPPGRPNEVYVGTNSGQIFRSRDSGATFAEVSFTGNGIGTVDDIRFCGPCFGDIMYILHNDAGPRGRLLRDFSGGAGGKDVEIVYGYDAFVSGGIDLNALDCCTEGEVIVGGAVQDGYPMLIRSL